MIRYLLASTMLVSASAAFAQQTTNTEPAPPSGAAATQDATQAASPVDAGIADIVVTAARRSENVQRSALSIQAISADEISRRGVTRPEDLSSLAPGVSVATGGNYPQTYIRGVGNYAVSSYAEGAVAYNLDGVYISRARATRGMFFDLDRVEVLKGPQGTLYGRNASGGAVNVITARPKLDRTEGFVELEAGSYDLDTIADVLCAAARQLEAIGAAMVLISAVTGHLVADRVAAALSVPLLHIADPTGAALRDSGHRTVALLGTRFTMEHDFIARRLRDDYGLQVVVPDADDRQTLHAIITDELTRGVVTDAAKTAVRGICTAARRAGADAIAVACTELPLLMAAETYALPAFDMALHHAGQAVAHAIAATAPRG